MCRTGDVLTILHKQPDGAWAIARDANLLVAEPSTVNEWGLPMSEMPNIVNMNDLGWEEAHYSEHYSGWSKRLTPSMNRKEGHIGVVVERLKPKSLSCPFHYHVHKDEFFIWANQREKSFEKEFDFDRFTQLSTYSDRLSASFSKGNLVL